MFDIDRFAADCRTALAERGSDAIREVVRRAVSEPGDIIAALGEQTGRRIAERRSSEEGREGIAAFLARRAPAWRHG